MKINTTQEQGKKAIENLLKIFKEEEYKKKQEEIIKEIFQK